MYRPDIDGLRAFAILSVCIFHIFPEFSAGGFIGVDIFFVISGYLIALKYFDKNFTNYFVVLDFYGRRILRLTPALIAVLVFCFIVGFFTFPPNEYANLGKHILAGSTFSSNFFLWSESGYFDKNSLSKPLLHLWSLGVEEQFYLIFPIIIFLTSSFSRVKRFFFISLLGISSFIYCLYLIKVDPVGAYYSPFSRIWEIALGILLVISTSQIVLSAIIRSRFMSVVDICGGWIWCKNIFSFLGVVLIVIGLVICNKDRNYPGYYALYPTLGAAFIIAAGPSAFINKMISSPIFVWFGLISFPLYLWHWPLLSIAYTLFGTAPSYLVRFSILICSIFLAWLTFRFMEPQFRHRFCLPRTQLLLLSSILIVGVWGYISQTQLIAMYRESLIFTEQNLGNILDRSTADYLNENFYPCRKDMKIKSPINYGFYSCYQSQPVDEIDIAIIGDSHGELLFLGLADAMPSKNIVYYSQWSLPVLANPEFNYIFDEILGGNQYQVVIIASAWWRRYVDDRSLINSSFRAELSKTVKRINDSGRRLYISDDNPFFKIKPYSCKYKSLFFSGKCEEDSHSLWGTFSLINSALEDAIKNVDNARILKVMKYFCDTTSCKMAINGKILFKDGDHLSIEGAKYLGGKVISDNPDLGL